MFKRKERKERIDREDVIRLAMAFSEYLHRCSEFMGSGDEESSKHALHPLCATAAQLALMQSKTMVQMVDQRELNSLADMYLTSLINGEADELAPCITLAQATRDQGMADFESALRRVDFGLDSGPAMRLLA